MDRARTQDHRSDHATQLLVNQNQILSMIASGARKDEVLRSICLKLEAMITNAGCSVMLFDRERKLLRLASAPSACTELIEALDGTNPGEVYGSCAAAAYTGEPAIVSDTATDPRWEAIRDAVERFNIRACWSFPIRIDDELLVGTFAVSHSKPCEPTRFDLELLETGAYLVGMLVRRDRMEAKLKDQSRMVLEAQDAERSVLARELHDGIGQMLYGLQLSLRAKTSKCDIDLERELASLDEAFVSVRDVSRLLAPPQLETMRLSAAIREYVCTHDSSSVPQVTLACTGTEPDLRFETRSHVFRTVQEAVTNARKHAKATHVKIEFDWTGASAVLRVEDDGVGMPDVVHEGVGMRSTRLRAGNVEGSVRWMRGPSGRGTTVELEFPSSPTS